MAKMKRKKRTAPAAPRKPVPRDPASGRVSDAVGKVFHRVVNLMTSRPLRFKAGGEWLDERFGPKAWHERHGGPGGVAHWKMCRSAAIWEAAQELVEAGRSLSLAEVQAVFVITWLLWDRDADQQGVRLTAFQDWAWGDVSDLEHGTEGRAFASATRMWDRLGGPGDAPLGWGSEWAKAVEGAIARLGLQERAAKEATGAGTERRFWTKPYCPSCGKEGLEWLSGAEFTRRCGEKGSKGPARKTVGRRVRSGGYCADRTGKLPWCADCQGKTPEGDGSAPLADPSDKGQLKPPDALKETAQDCVTRLVRRHDEDFDPGMYDPESGRQEHSRALCSEGYAAIMEKWQRQGGGAMPEEEMERVADKAMRDFMRRETEAHRRLPQGRMAGSNRPEE